MTEILLLAITISGLSLGFRAITSPKMIFYFLRKPFDKLSERNKWLEKEWNSCLKPTEGIRESYMTSLQRKLKINKVILYLGKPVILCSTCMSSLHTILWWPYFNDNYTWDVIPCILTVALLNTFLWGLIELIQTLIEANGKKCEK